MKLATHDLGDVHIIRLSGKIMGGMETATFYDALKDAVDKNHKKVILDLGEVEWMNSSGLGLMVAALARLRSADAQLKLARPNNTLNQLFQLNKLNLVFDIHQSLDEASKSFAE
jgi:anti-sigma B factor antagonist